MRSERVVVIGAGMAGLAAALRLAVRGVEVTVVERAADVGGKLREVRVGASAIDAGPTVFTMRWVFDEIFADAGEVLSDHLGLRSAEVLARHAWSADQRLDLFADEKRSTDAIGDFAGAKEAAGFVAFCQRAREIFETLEQSYIRAAQPSPLGLVRDAGARGLLDLWKIKPFDSLWSALSGYFQDARLRQLFGRYATYCGSSPFLAPATLMLVAHVEQRGVWLIEGGMHRLAKTMKKLAEARGAKFRFGQTVTEVQLSAGCVKAVVLESGECLEADAVVINADVAAVARGHFGEDIVGAVPPVTASPRSLSAVTWAVDAKTSGFPLLRHNVFFSQDYAAEFSEISNQGRLPQEPTVYVCAQDREDKDVDLTDQSERLFCLVNAPAIGDTHPFDEAEIEACRERTFGLMERCGLQINQEADMQLVTTPANFERLFPATGGALYGTASHGWRTSFARPTVKTKIPGLYLAGGSVHPGPGLPMAALSGCQAATALWADLASQRPSRMAATLGGTSTR